jgi:ABC-2 type transport system permease protein
MIATIATFGRLRWRLIRGAIRLGGVQQLGAVLGLAMAIIAAVGGFFAGLFIDRIDANVADLRVFAITGLVAATLAFGVIAGVTQSVDPRVIAAEPLTDIERAAGILATVALGPVGLATIAIGAGLAIGAVDGAGSVPILALAIGSWLASLLLAARTVTNALALLAARFPRGGQLIVGVTGLAFYAAFQLVPAWLSRLDEADRHRVADALRFAPPGQIASAFEKVGSEPGMALLHVVVASLWIPLLAAVFVSTTTRLGATVSRSGVKSSAPDRHRMGRLVRYWCGSGPAGALAWRFILVRLRTPRTLLETITGSALGVGAVLIPSLVGDTPGSGAVLVGGAIQLAVLFGAGNTFGNSGPPIIYEFLAGADPRTFVRGGARAVLIVAAPLALIGPLLTTAITGEWSYFAAGIGVGIGGLFAGTGAAVVQSALVPIAIPESDNPFAGGESGKGIVAALLLVCVLTGLAVVTVPIAVLLVWATFTGDVIFTTVCAVATVFAGWIVMRLGERIATAHIMNHEPEFVASVTPAR